MLKLMLVSSDKNNISEAEKAGVDRIFLDLEYIGKSERQFGRNTYFTHNTIDDVKVVRRWVKKAEYVVRVNPINPNSKTEIDKVIEGGADIVMLPMVIDAEDVSKFVDYVGGRAKTMPMIETAPAMVRLDELISVGGIDEFYIGLNDLNISLGTTFMFESLSGGLIDFMAEKIKAANIKFGFGGIAKIGEGLLPSEYIIGEHYRLGSSCVILSRTFRNELVPDSEKVDIVKEVGKIRLRENEISNWSKADFDRNKEAVREKVELILKNINSKKGY